MCRILHLAIVLRQIKKNKDLEFQRQVIKARVQELVGVFCFDTLWPVFVMPELFCYENPLLVSLLRKKNVQMCFLLFLSLT